MNKAATLVCILLALSGCGSADKWKTERYHDDGLKRDVVVAKRIGKQDGIELTVAARCAVPDQLSFEFYSPATFRVADAAGQKVLTYKIGIDGQPAVDRQAAFKSADTLTIDSRLPAAGTAPAMDLRTAGRIAFELFTPNGSTNVSIMPTDPGLGQVLSACGIDPSQAVALQAAEKLHRPAPSLLPQHKDKVVNLQTISGTWACGGDLGYFGLKIDSYAYQMSEESPWGNINGQVTLGPLQAGVDNNPTYPITLAGGPWDGDDTPWTYSPLGSEGGTIYYVQVDTGQTTQCTRS